jgi:hypothetical protein
VPSDFIGRVHSVHRQACNIETEDGTLVALLSGALGNQPRGVRCSVAEAIDFRSLCSASELVECSGAELRMPRAGVTVDLGCAVVWHCALSACSIDRVDARTVNSLFAVRTMLAKQEGGFAPLVLRDGEPSSELDRAMLRRLERALPVLETAIRGCDADRMIEALAPLVGLGPGLTPSGDDFIVGLLAALWSRRDCHALLMKLREPLTRLAATTHAISRQFLLDALAGEFGEPLSDLAVAISMRDQRRVSAAAQRVLRVGHTSGADALTGFLFGMQPALVHDRPGSY